MNKLESKFLIGQRFLFDPYDNSLIDQHESDELTRLGSNESRALSLLIEDPGAIITRHRLHEYVWREQGFEVDDSSLTQAISTLRKALKDSTKSPEFIKTVPKRGYQMIAMVESLSEIDSSTSAEQAETLAEKLDEPSEIERELFEHSQQVTTAKTYSPASHSQTPKRPLPMAAISGVLVLMALLLPILVNLGMPPKSAAFEPFAVVDDVPVLTPANHPSLTQWQGMITQCVESYLSYHPADKRPMEVIVSGGQHSQLWVNYVHSFDNPAENVTLRLLTSHKDNVSICQ
ncbi:winged helix-turn-helix domain-containing protein [Photobacterium sp. ZSDE20]|uniref:Winged helix-turn-helix domain-containing protein n=1 Tax=Photobacterium pectinilyticum TaxID=2906793 RepID=A0ABT1MVS5_9GAMM|nr:winged helix-turn-helix domain-containing protein [Photobacterium sp. ZSDE20]MCQ1056596.1 winged helix-turn-helix domain-containing protein [Photobacterium sp. ZSDE20]MDD1820731.1 winged helix-turn-helix domain-containing protein [Photobacterium sp. ZSDE20]